jgi:hypothetical protein
MNIPGDIIVSIDGLLNYVHPGQRIYVMSPYSHDDPLVVEGRFEAVAEATMFWSTHGLAVFSPIVHSHTLVKLGGYTDIQTNWQTWKPIDMPWLEVADVGVSLMLPGWDESEGVGEEEGFVRASGIPLYFVEPVMGGFND